MLLPFITAAQNACVSMAVIGASCAPASFQLFACTQDATDAQWSFPGSTTPTQTGLFTNALYTTAGTYTISVVIDIPGGTVDTTFNIIVSESPSICVSPPIATGCTGQTLCFDASCTAGFGLTYAWDFGDGQTSDANTPCHDYTDSACYDVQLTVTDSFGCAAETTLNEFACVDPLLVACFTSVNSPCNCSAPYTVELQSCSSPSSGLTFQWNTPGGQSSTPNASTNPVIYNTVGFYDVSLTVMNSGGCSDTISVQDFICISSFSPTFEIVDSVFVTGVPVSFLAGPATSFAWTVTPSTVDTIDDDQILTVTFNQPGNYEVCLLATFNGCAAEKCTTMVITNPTSVYDATRSNNLVYYNDFANDIIISQLSSEFSNFELVDITGRTVFNGSIENSSTKSFDVSQLPKGIYGYRMLSNNNLSFKNGLVLIR